MREALTIIFLADWQIASGLGDGHLADAVLARDHEGLPVIPGRALKGALREGAWQLAQCGPDLARAEIFFWGGRSTGEDSARPGRLYVSPGELEPSVRYALLACPTEKRDSFVRDLTCRRAQTALDENRQARAQSLRTLECGIPGTVFTAELEIRAPEVDDGWTRRYFTAVCAAVKSMGGGRSRGFGACCIRLDNCGRAALPLPVPEAVRAAGDGGRA